MKRLILFLLTASLLLTSMTGCLLGGPQNNETTPEQGTPFGTTPSLPEDLTTPPPEETTPPAVDIVTPAPDGEHPFGTEDVSFNAGTFTQLIVLSHSYILNVEVKDGKIYICDILYECKGIVDNFDISLQDAFLVGVEEEKIEILEKIQNCETCYLLETQNDNIYGKKIAVYYIDGFYYFVTPAGESPLRIHFAKASADEPTANNETVPTPVAGAPLGRENTTLVADLYASYGDGVREDTLDIKVVKGQIFINDIAYTVLQNAEAPKTDYETEAICSQVINSAAAIETLKKIESSSAGWVLEADSFDPNIGYHISVYYIDSTYYFMIFFGDGNFRGLYYATAGAEHSYDDGVIVEDVILYTCLTCGETKTVEVPADFAFSLTWGFDGGYDSKTGLLKNGYNYQLGVDCETTLILTREELMNVYRLLYNANAFAIKEDFTVSKILGHPFYRVKFSYSVGCEVFKFTIDGESFVGDYRDWEVHQEFGYAYYQIVDFIKSTEEYKALPPNTNAYD